MDLDLTDGERRLAAISLAASGVLDVTFSPSDGATRRVRLVGSDE